MSFISSTSSPSFLNTKAVIQIDRYKTYRRTNCFLLLPAKFYKPLHYKMTNLCNIFVENGNPSAHVPNIHIFFGKKVPRVRLFVCLYLYNIYTYTWKLYFFVQQIALYK